MKFGKTNTDHHCTITIVMGTYNGEKYIAEQIDSIIQQTYRDWCLLVRDDGSTDGTVAIIRAYTQNHPNIFLLEDTLGNVGFNRNFMTLIEQTGSPYISVCDQDDVWLPNKLMTSLNAIQAIEKSSDMPALVHSDALIVDSQLKPIAEKWIGKRGAIEGLNGIAFANAVQGASLMFNRALKELAVATPLLAPYDYHLALLSVLKGKRYFIQESLLLYRQHSNNAIGGMQADTQLNMQHYVRQFKQIAANLMASLDYQKLNPTIHHSLNAYHLIKNNYAHGLIVASQKKALDEYFYIFEGHSTIKKIYLFLKNKYGFGSKKDRIIFLMLIITGRNLLDPSSW